MEHNLKKKCKNINFAHYYAHLCSNNFMLLYK